MRLNSVQLETLRKRPQQTKLYLSIFQPQAIFKAQVNDSSIAKGARTITYDSVSLGVFSAIQANMTMWVGTTPGAMDVGKIRVRSATSTVITVSENSNIEWADNLYLTIFYYVELWQRFENGFLCGLIVGISDFRQSVVELSVQLFVHHNFLYYSKSVPHRQL